MILTNHPIIYSITSIFSLLHNHMIEPHHMIPNTLLSSKDEKISRKFLWIGFFLLPIIWLINFIIFFPKLNQVSKSKEYLLRIAQKTKDYRQLQRLSVVQRSMFTNVISLSMHNLQAVSINRLVRYPIAFSNIVCSLL